MADTTTANYAFTKVEIGGSPSTWGNKLNANFDSIDTQIKARADAIGLRAPIASPEFTGVPTAPTAAARTNNTQLATTAYVDQTARRYRVVGEITDIPHENIPYGWVECNGQALSRAAHPELFAVLGTNYGAGDGVTTFNVPNYRECVRVSRTVAGAQSVPPDGRNGINTTQVNSRAINTGLRTLARTNLPYVQINVNVAAVGDHAHSYAIPGVSAVAGGSIPVNANINLSGATTGGAGAHGHTANTDPLGDNTPFGVFQPSVVVVTIIYAGILV